ncbi:MAG: hypothetical protein Q8Q29_02870 [Actinomycetota bacterium]|nr:hypothetical protein [Actinomycetota bacterium]
MTDRPDLSDLNPVTDDHGERWARSPEGERARDRMLARTEVTVGAEPAPHPRRRLARYLVPAAALALIAATVVFVRDDARAPFSADECPVTNAVPPYLVPPEPWPATPPPLVPMHAGHWYGTEDLWTIIPFDGARFAPTGDKLFYWSRHFMTASDDFSEPELLVTAERLDGEANDVVVDHANNGGRADVGTFMVTGMELPSGGCWQITAEYRGAELSHIVWVSED